MARSSPSSGCSSPPRCCPTRATSGRDRRGSPRRTQTPPARPALGWASGWAGCRSSRQAAGREPHGAGPMRPTGQLSVASCESLQKERDGGTRSPLFQACCLRVRWRLHGAEELCCSPRLMENSGAKRTDGFEPNRECDERCALRRYRHGYAWQHSIQHWFCCGWWRARRRRRAQQVLPFRRAIAAPHHTRTGSRGTGKTGRLQRLKPNFG